MKEVVIVGLYRGEFLEGVMAVKYIMEMLPLDVGALDIGIGLEQLIRNWWGCQPPIKLDYVCWFTQDQGSESYFWSPPPAAMKTDVEMISEARHKRPYVYDITVCLWLMTILWRKKFEKINQPHVYHTHRAACLT